VPSNLFQSHAFIFSLGIGRVLHTHTHTHTHSAKGRLFIVHAGLSEDIISHCPKFNMPFHSLVTEYTEPLMFWSAVSGM